MGAQTLSTLMKDSRGSSDDLGTLIRQLVQAAEPLEGKFNGAGRVAFDQFKLRADGITKELDSSLAAILGGQSGMDSAFGSGDQEQGVSPEQYAEDPLALLPGLRSYVDRLPLGEFEQSDWITLHTDLTSYLGDLLVRRHGAVWTKVDDVTSRRAIAISWKRQGWMGKGAASSRMTW